MQYTPSFVSTQDPGALISLIAKRRQGEFAVRLNTSPHPRFIGTLKGDTLTKRINEKRHVLHNGDAIAFASALVLHSSIPFRWLVVDVDGVKFTTSRDFFVHHATAFQYRGQEPQLGLAKSLWGKELALKWEADEGRKERHRRERAAQGNFFEGVAA
jgi:hypothetical protein